MQYNLDMTDLKKSKWKIEVREGERYYASGPHSGKKVGSIRQKGVKERSDQEGRPIKEVSRAWKDIPQKEKVQIYLDHRPELAQELSGIKSEMASLAQESLLLRLKGDQKAAEAVTENLNSMKEKFEVLIQELNMKALKENPSKPSEEVAKSLKNKLLKASTAYYVAIVPIYRGKVLVGLRKEDGIYTTPAGGGKAGESPLDTAIRELQEECGLEVAREDLEFLHEVKAPNNGKTVYCYMLNLDDRPLRNNESEPFTHTRLDPDNEVFNWLWYLPENLPVDMSRPENSNRLETINAALIKYRKVLEEDVTFNVDLMGALEKHFGELMEKGRKAEIGEIRTWGKYRYQKQADGWYYVDGPHIGKKMGSVRASGKASKKKEEPKVVSLKEVLEAFDVTEISKEDAETLKELLNKYKSNPVEAESKASDLVSDISMEQKSNAVVKELKDKDPRQQAETLTSDREYFNARDSRVGNLGEDLKGSQRHKIGAYKASLAEMEADGSADKFVRRDVILKNDPIKVPEITKDNWQKVAVLATVLRGYAPAPKNNRYNTLNLDGAGLREAYFNTFQNVKKKIEELMTKDGSIDAALDELRVHVREMVHAERRRVSEIRGRGYDTSASADLVSLLNGPMSNYRSKSAKKRIAPLLSRSDEDGVEIAKKMALEGLTPEKALGITKTRKEEFNPATMYIKSKAEFKGGAKIPQGMAAQADFLMKDQGMRGLQWGNSVTDEEREYHLKALTQSFADLTDILGLPEQMGSFNGRLGLAVGARGKGTALAHYEPNSKVINLTRANGVGTLAHEWGHFFDNIVAEVSGSNRSYTSEIWGSSTDNSVEKAFTSLRGSEAWAEFSREVSEEARKVSPGKREYWKSGREMFARAFEAHISFKLHERGAKNTYLAAADYESSKLWPSRELSKKLAPHFDEIFKAFRESDLLKKALALLVSKKED